MTTWEEFANRSPEIAARGRGLIERSGIGEGLLATIHDDAPPRINPIYVEIVDGRLVAFIIVGSAKLADLTTDGRYALHAHQDPVVPHEFLIRGRASEVTDPALRDAAVAAWSFEIDDGYRLFEFSIEQAVFGERVDADAWPPRYTSWRSPVPTT